MHPTFNASDVFKLSTTRFDTSYSTSRHPLLRHGFYYSNDLDSDLRSHFSHLDALNPILHLDRSYFPPQLLGALRAPFATSIDFNSHHLAAFIERSLATYSIISCEFCDSNLKLRCILSRSTETPPVGSRFDIFNIFSPNPRRQFLQRAFYHLKSTRIFNLDINQSLVLGFSSHFADQSMNFFLVDQHTPILNPTHISFNLGILRDAFNMTSLHSSSANRSLRKTQPHLGLFGCGFIRETNRNLLGSALITRTSPPWSSVLKSLKAQVHPLRSGICVHESIAIHPLEFRLLVLYPIGFNSA
ncbi:hypothetical protein C8R43DRAFT_1137310 [Mycena crocata]|nr:hypothetical protein C8R43DRAFT_1137310 [Mycena crocata]